MCPPALACVPAPVFLCRCPCREMCCAYIPLFTGLIESILTLMLYKDLPVGKTVANTCYTLLLGYLLLTVMSCR